MKPTDQLSTQDMPGFRDLMPGSLMRATVGTEAERERLMALCFDRGLVAYVRVAGSRSKRGKR